jgi:cell division protein FtsB
LTAEVEDLRTGTEASEERARAELGMMRQGELFVQILPPDAKAPEIKPSLKPGAKPVSAVPVKPGSAMPASATRPAQQAVRPAAAQPAAVTQEKTPARTQ